MEVAVNMTMVKENARRFHSPGGATGGTVSRASVNRVRFAAKSGEGRYPKHRDMTGKQQQQASGQQCWRCCGKHAPQACKFKSEQCLLLHESICGRSFAETHTSLQGRTWHTKRVCRKDSRG